MISMTLTFNVFKVANLSGWIIIFLNIFVAVYPLNNDMYYFVRYTTMWVLIPVIWIVFKKTLFVSVGLRNLFLIVISLLFILYNPVFPIHLTSQVVRIIVNIIICFMFLWFIIQTQRYQRKLLKK
jgi:hypothetical protein